MSADLPRDTVGDWPVCPWCVADGLFRPWRGDLGQPDPDALTIECICCGRPSMVALRDGQVRLLAVRTKADVELLGGVWGKPL